MSDIMETVANLLKIGAAVSSLVARGEFERVNKIISPTSKLEIARMAARAEAEEKFGPR